MTAEPPPLLGTRPGWTVLTLRGLRRRCPRCGAGRLFARWFRMAERCPGWQLQHLAILVRQHVGRVE